MIIGVVLFPYNHVFETNTKPVKALMDRNLKKIWAAEEWMMSQYR